MYKKAFSLVELSIVLIIIGLLVSSVSYGSKLIMQSKLNKVINDLTKFEIATNTFYTTYGAIPGDFDEASIYWPSCTDVASNACNGNNDGALSYTYEGMRFWQHLSLAELVSGSYTGANSSGDDNEAIPGENAPISPLGRGCYFANQMGTA